MTKFLFEVVVKNDQIYLFRNIKDFSHILLNYFRIYFVENDEKKNLVALNSVFKKVFYVNRSQIAQKRPSPMNQNDLKVVSWF